ncbi:DDE superfamily endonuclease [Hirsutella rhossiliensis]|uniref:DDE superfamily endonuclease domain-containing protein n=1 Tax=Hirsutella rhossiliensis TaxID=111463 RepID=A0A9P8N5R9_9HYPO|nr:DDE superfamily endonuclease domain-containing protein [Hirsutella rhossiliensis]KAH0967360.1 DDE superfamily endonuclease domain-containing protein [Hirsutella rhossiliensis]
MTATGDQSVPREERVLLAVRAYQQGQFKSTRKAAAAYDVPQSTVSDRLRGVIRRRDVQMNNLKLTATEETALVQWILSMDERGMPPTVAYTRRMANLLLSSEAKILSGKTGCGSLLAATAKSRQSTLADTTTNEPNAKTPKRSKDGTIESRRRNRNGGFLTRMSITLMRRGFKWESLQRRVLTRSDRRGRAVLTQPGNREWVTVIESINCQGWALPAKVIFQGKLHQASWYESGVPDDWHIAVSENGWTSDDLALNWLKEVFDPNTRRRTVGTHRLLILDGHGSHVTPEFDKYCTANSIVVLQMPAHSSHLLQPLDVGAFRR